ncbi:MAG: hypothetical protein H0X30_32675 [Anaerolineae bacterium]|nr:hypothetical protein [Anaerolineae bacterium]
MECIISQPLSDEALSLALDGLANQETQEHLLQCPACNARLTNMKRLDFVLQQRLRRFDCPSPQELADYQTGLLDADPTTVVKQHLADCPRCQNDLAMLKQFLNLSSDEDAVSDKIIPTGIPHNIMRANRVAVSGNLALKGLDNETSHDMQAGSVRIFLESRASSQGIQLSGQVIDNEINWVGAVVEAWQEGTPRHISILDDMCEFTFEFDNKTPVTLYITAAIGKNFAIEEISI